MTVRQIFFLLLLVVPLAVVLLDTIWTPFHWLFVIIIPLLLLGLIDVFRKQHSIRRIYPVVGRIQYLFESVRKEIQQYFVESDINGVPVSREFRSLIHQRAKGDRDTRPFGTIFDVNRDGIFDKDLFSEKARQEVG